MIYPAYYEVVIPNQATFSQIFQLKTQSGNPLDLTGHEVRASVWTEDKKQKIVDFDFEWIEQTGGKFSLTIPEDVTTKIDKSGIWDLLVVNPDLTEDYWLRGPAVVSKGYTK